MAQTPPIRIDIDPGAADQLRALIESLAEALERMTECARLATTMAAELTATQAPATVEVLCQACGGTGLAPSGAIGDGRHGDECLTCMGGGTVGQVMEDKLAEAITKPLDTQVLMGDVPLQRMPASADYTIPRVVVTGVDAETLCPECRAGKFINCTTYPEGLTPAPGEMARCATWDTYMEDHEEGQTFGLWLLGRGMA